MDSIDNLATAIILEIAFQEICKIHPTNCDMYNREKFYEEVTVGSLYMGTNLRFWIYRRALNYRNYEKNTPRVRTLLRIF